MTGYDLSFKSFIVALTPFAATPITLLTLIKSYALTPSSILISSKILSRDILIPNCKNIVIKHAIPTPHYFLCCHNTFTNSLKCKLKIVCICTHYT